MVLLIFPVGRWVELTQARRSRVAVTAEAVEPLPVLPSGLANEVVWVEASRPVTEMSNLVLHWPAILVAFLGGRLGFFEQTRRDLMATEPSWSFLTFLTVIGMWQNTAILEDEEAFFANRIPGISILRSIIDRFFLDL